MRVGGLGVIPVSWTAAEIERADEIARGLHDTFGASISEGWHDPEGAGH